MTQEEFFFFFQNKFKNVDLSLRWILAFGIVLNERNYLIVEFIRLINLFWVIFVGEKLMSQFYGQKIWDHIYLVIRWQF